MNPGRFDDLARSMGTGLNRRRLLRGMVGAGAFPFIGEILDRVARDRKVVVCHRGRAISIAASAVKAHLARGDVRPIPGLSSDPNNCGACGIACVLPPEFANGCNVAVCQASACGVAPVPNGTPCRPGSRDVCRDGECVEFCAPAYEACEVFPASPVVGTCCFDLEHPETACVARAGGTRVCCGFDGLDCPVECNAGQACDGCCSGFCQTSGLCGA